MAVNDPITLSTMVVCQEHDGEAGSLTLLLDPASDYGFELSATLRLVEGDPQYAAASRLAAGTVCKVTIEFTPEVA